jgi:tetratricopeptide (TPR) repeat protein
MAEREHNSDAFAEYKGLSPSFDLLSPESEERADSLRRALRRSKGFSLHVVIADGTARRELLRRLRAWSGTGGVPRLYFFDEGEIGARALERWLAEAWEKKALTGAVLLDGDALIANGSALSALNVARDRLGQLIRGPFIVVLSPRSEAEMATLAPDLFDVRAGTWEFEAAPLSEQTPQRSVEFLWDKAWPDVSKGDLRLAAASLRALGSAEEPPPAGALANAWLKLGMKFHQANEVGEAIAASEEAERHAKLVSYDSGIGEALLLKARALVDSGRLIEAEPFVREALERYHAAADVRSQAIALNDLAGVLHKTGRLDDAHSTLVAALKLYRDIHDERGIAMLHRGMAHILMMRGQLEDALRIYKEECLPVFERLGDDPGRAVTLGRMADTLRMRGQLEAALRIYQDEVLPVFKRLGDLHGCAVTWGRIADILEMHGRVDEAMRIRIQEELPVFETLGDIYNRAITWGKIAIAYWRNGRRDEAIRILADEQLTVYEELNDVHGLLIAQTNLAVLYLERNEPGDRDKAAELLRRARTAAERLRVPEIQEIRAFQARAGLDDEGGGGKPSEAGSE